MPKQDGVKEADEMSDAIPLDVQLTQSQLEVLQLKAKIDILAARIAEAAHLQFDASTQRNILEKEGTQTGRTQGAYGKGSSSSPSTWQSVRKLTVTG